MPTINGRKVGYGKASMKKAKRAAAAGKKVSYGATKMRGKATKASAGTSKAKTRTSMSPSQAKAKGKKAAMVKHYSGMNQPKSATAKKKGPSNKRKTLRRLRSSGGLNRKTAGRARKYSKK